MPNLSTILAALLAASVSSSMAAQPNRPRPTRAPGHVAGAPTSVPGSWIVKLKSNAIGGSRAPTQVVTDAAGGASRVRSVRGHASSHFRDLVVLQADSAVAAALASSPDVESVEQDSLIYTAAVSMAPIEGGLCGGGSRALAQRSGWNAALDRADQRSLPLDSAFNFVLDGAGVDIFVFDSGINPAHAEFTGRVATDLARNFAADGGNALNDCNGHGTFVASQAAGAVVGVASAARIIPVRVFDCAGSGTVSALVSSTDYAISTRTAQGSKPSVINFSGGGGASATMDSLAARATSAGILWVDAAGNEAVNSCTRSPARSPAGLTVGASNAADAFAPFSNFGACVNVSGVGVDNIGAWPTGSDVYAQGSGTSFSAPIVSGIAAALWGAMGPATPASTVGRTLVQASTPNLITSLPTGTANLLAYSAPDGLTPDVVPSTTPSRTASASAPPPSGTASSARSATASRVPAAASATRTASASNKRRPGKLA